MRTPKLLLLLALLGCAPALWALGAERAASLNDLGARIEIHSPVISPDGKHIAVVTSAVNYGDNRFQATLMLIEIAQGSTRVLASGAERPAAPQWSPQGDRLAWLANDAQGGQRLRIMRLDDRKSRAPDASAVGSTFTTLLHGIRIQSYAWSPDGKLIAYISPEQKPEAQGEQRYNKSFEVTANDYLATEPPPSYHVWVVSARGGESRELTHGIESVAAMSWAADGKSILFVSQPYPHNSRLDFAEFMNANSSSTALKQVDVASGAVRVIVPTPGRIWGPPKVATDGRAIAYATFRGPEPWSHRHDVAIVGISGGAVRDLTAHLDRDIAEYEWLPGQHALLVTAPDRTRWAMWKQALDGRSKQIDLGAVVDLTGLTVSTQTGAVAFVGTEAERPSEIYFMASIRHKPKRLTHFNDRLASLRIGRAQTIKWRLDGFDETGVLILPADFRSGHKYPLVLDIHGGPEAASTEAFDLLDQIFAGRGWIVFKPNYRGSDSQGDAFESAIINDLGKGPGRDVMAGVAAVKALGFVDETRVAVSGWSYGGYMTVWLIGHYQGWSSAVAGAPLSNLLDWYDLSCCNAWAAAVLGGSPWRNNNLENYWRQSPVFYADRVKTPTLILQNMGDPEVPYTGSYSLFHALRDNGVDVRFVVYPLQGHGYRGEPVQQRDTVRRWVSWIDEHFRTAAQATR